MRTTSRLLAGSIGLSAALSFACSNHNTVASARHHENGGGSAGKSGSGASSGTSGSSGSGGTSGVEPSCEDAIQNGDEEGVDCGGSCEPCACSEDLGENVARCSGECVDLDEDPEHCGRCGASCDEGTQACVSGECVECDGVLGPGRLSEKLLPADTFALHSTIVDIDGDSRGDLLYSAITSTSETTAHSVRVKLGDGKGGFSEERELAAGRIAHVFELNDDQHDDIAYIDGDGALVVLYGDGKGTFSSSEPMSVGLVASSIAAADLDHDQRPDLVVSNHDSQDVSVLLADPEGGFFPEQRIALEFAPTRVQARDVNRDGHVDLVVGGKEVLQALFGDGDGGFSAGYLDEEPLLGDFALADLDGNARPDLVLAFERTESDPDWVHGRVGVLLDYDGLVSAGMTYHLAGDGRGLALADVNGDGHQDIAAPNVQTFAVDVLIARGDGTFDAPRSYGVGRLPVGLALGDLNQDESADLVSIGYDLEVVLGEGGLFGHRVYPSLDWSRNLLLADVSGDGVLDALVTNTWGGNLVVHEGIPGGFFREPVRVTHDPDNVGGYGPPMALGDFDGDGRLEMALAREGVSIYGRSPEGGFEWRDTIAWPGYITALVTGDLNGDGQPDLIGTEGYTDTLRVRLGEPDAQFGPAKTYSTGDWPTDALVVDVNGDAHLDVVVASFTAGDHGTIDVFLGDGEGNLTAQPRLDVPTHPLGIAAADLDRDGKLDLVARFRGGFHVLRGDGAGGFTTLSTHQDGSLSLSEHAQSLVAIQDFSGDGLLDVAVTIPDEARIALYRGTGDGGLLEPSYYHASLSSAVVAADLDEDGLPDLAALGHDTVTVVLNRARCE